MLLGRIHLAEGEVAARRHEHRIIAEAAVSARRPDERSVDPAFEPFAVAVRPAQGQSADEVGVPARVGTGGLERFLDPAHRQAEIALPFDLSGPAFGRNPRIAGKRPAGREDPRTIAERLDAQAAIVGKRGKAGQVGGGD